MLTPLDIKERVSVILHIHDDDYENRERMTHQLYSAVLREITRKDCIDPRSLAIEVLKAENFEPEDH